MGRLIKILLIIIVCGVGVELSAQAKLTTFTKNSGLTSSSILFTYVDTRGVIWAATKDGLNAFSGKEWIPIARIFEQDGSEKKLGRVLNIFETSKGDMWVATEKGLFVYDRKSWVYYADREKIGFVVKILFEDSIGNIWVLSEKQGGMKEVSELGFFLMEGDLQMYNGWQWFDYTGVLGGSAAISLGNPADYFTSIVQLGNGALWISTQDGLYIYDEGNWDSFGRDVVSTDRCLQVFESSQNELWVATVKGMVRKNDTTWDKFEEIEGLSANIPYRIFEDAEQRIWVLARKGTRFKTISYYLDGKWSSYSVKDMRQKGEVKFVGEIQGEIWTLSDKGISVFSHNKWKTLAQMYGIKDHDYSQLLLLKDSSIVFATNKGLYKLKSKQLIKLISFESGWEVTCLHEGLIGDIWVGTKKEGVYLINHQNIQQFTKTDGLADDGVESVFNDKQNNIWIVTEEGISRFSEQ